jgi:hypothetical protein
VGVKVIRMVAVVVVGRGVCGTYSTGVAVKLAGGIGVFVAPALIPTANTALGAASRSPAPTSAHGTAGGKLRRCTNPPGTS